MTGKIDWPQESPVDTVVRFFENAGINFSNEDGSTAPSCREIAALVLATCELDDFIKNLQKATSNTSNDNVDVQNFWQQLDSEWQQYLSDRGMDSKTKCYSIW